MPAIRRHIPTIRRHIPTIPDSHNVLCALDLTSKSVPLIQWASGFARDHGANLKLVHAVPGAEPRGGVDIEGGRFRAFLFDVAREAVAEATTRSRHKC